MTIDELHTKMDQEFATVREDMQAGFAAVRAEIKVEAEATRRHFAEVKAEINADGEVTRRHFDMMVEHMKDSVKVFADGTARNTERIDDHERRLKALEKPA